MKSLIKITVRYGVFAGLLATAVLITLYYLGRHPLLISPFLDFRILAYSIFIFFSLKEFREYYQDDILYFWQGLIGSMILVFTATTTASIGLQIFGSMDEGFVPSYISLMTEYLKSFPQRDIDIIGKDIFARNLSQLSATNISELTITYFVQGLGIGLFISIILSVILRKQPKN